MPLIVGGLRRAQDGSESSLARVASAPVSDTTIKSDRSLDGDLPGELPVKVPAPLGAVDDRARLGSVIGEEPLVLVEPEARNGGHSIVAAAVARISEQVDA